MSDREMGRLRRLSAEDLERLWAIGAEGSSNHAQQLAHTRWFYAVLHGRPPRRSPRHGPSSFALPISSGIVRVSGLAAKLTRADLRRIIRALELWRA